MVKTISVGQLRKNPTEMLRDVRKGTTYTITDHGEPVAEVSPRREPRWVSGEEFSQFLSEQKDRIDDSEWIQDIEDLRDEELPRDPWESRG